MTLVRSGEECSIIARPLKGEGLTAHMMLQLGGASVSVPPGSRLFGWTTSHNKSTPLSCFCISADREFKSESGVDQ